MICSFVAAWKGKVVFMKLKYIKYYITAVVVAVTVLAGIFGSAGVVRSFAAEKTLVEIEAFYMDGAVEVGQHIDKTKISVTGHYVLNGKLTTSEIKSGFTVTPDVVTKEGTNVMTVFYQGCTATFTVEGKKIQYLSAEYVGKEVVVGQHIAKESVRVTAFFSDGTMSEITDFSIPVTEITEEGINMLTVVCGNKMTDFMVMGVAPRMVEQIYAYYYGDPVIVGNAVDKAKIEAEAFYNDGTIEKIKNFNLSPDTVTREGENKIILSYGGASTEIYVEGLAKEIESVSVKYTGYGVILGKTVDRNDVEVIATYNDGTTGRIDSFTLSGSLITMEGDNLVLVYCGYFVEEIIVPGVKGFSINYNNTIDELVFGTFGDYSMVTLAMKEGLAKNSFFISELPASVVERVVKRAIPTEEFIGFTITYDEDDFIKEFPMGIKVTVPEGYDPERFGVYYTPNQKTILAKLDGEFLDEAKTEYQFVVYEPGTYILVNAVSNLLVEEIVIDEEMDVKAGRNYSLKPLIFPINAENKKVTYWSSDEEVATVSENGNIRTYTEGTCEIWIEAQDGSGVRAIVTLNVKAR